jgi:hypothetical protein
LKLQQVFFSKFLFILVKMSADGKLSPEEFVTAPERPSSNGKPSSQHVEDTSQERPKTPRVPYWDTKNVIGAKRNLSLTPEESNEPQEKKSSRRGFWGRRWVHFKRHWILYAIAIVVLLAVGLPVLYASLNIPSYENANPAQIPENLPSYCPKTGRQRSSPHLLC